jgi:antitoxin component YwqK of YwqJK toxin-antitoxin module
MLLSFFFNETLSAQACLDYTVILDLDKKNNHDTIEFESVGLDDIIKRYWNYNNARYVGKESIMFDSGLLCIGTWTPDTDTVNYNDKVIVFNNPFPNVYLHLDSDSSNSNFEPYSANVTGYTYMFYPDGKIKAKCILQDKKGTLYGMWYENGMPESLGYFNNNNRIGKWKFWNEYGKLTIKEY